MEKREQPATGVVVPTSVMDSEGGACPHAARALITDARVWLILFGKNACIASLWKREL